MGLLVLRQICLWHRKCQPIAQMAGRPLASEEVLVELKELIDLHEKLESRINAYWSYWSVAIFAIAGWLFSGKQSLLPQQKIGISIALAVFFFANLGVLWPATRLVTGIRDEIRLKTKEINFYSIKLAHAFAEDSLAFRLQLTFVLHLVVDCVVIWALFSA